MTTLEAISEDTHIGNHGELKQPRKREQLLDFDVIHVIRDFFEVNGEFIPMLHRLCWNRDLIWEFRRPGIYCFAEYTFKPLDPMMFTYVGRTHDLHKRFCEHKRNWLSEYILSNNSRVMWWGYIFEEDIPPPFSMSSVENTCWQNEQKLGLTRCERLIMEYGNSNEKHRATKSSGNRNDENPARSYRRSLPLRIAARGFEQAD